MISSLSDTIGMARSLLDTGAHRRPRESGGGNCALVVEADDRTAREYVKRLRLSVDGERVVRARNLSDVADAMVENRVSAAVVGEVKNRAIVMGALATAGARVCDVEADDCAASVEWRASVSADGEVAAETRRTAFSRTVEVERASARLNPAPGRGAVGLVLPHACLLLTLTVSLPPSLTLRDVHAEVRRKDGERVALDAAGASHEYHTTGGLAVLTVTRPQPGLRYVIVWEHVA